ncbi:hypothetical protein [Nannocystis pusilla]|uniref:Uncharacterized protein n=1 Tax=Nannocystis pusilla TaxID=889268 RepID=A0ABS7TLT8_9BACT|nr:hypothetical protein [Nannocystis pusilla]MBZ5709184.1 hypothetical protein [Nannocystis pusilla]
MKDASRSSPSRFRHPASHVAAAKQILTGDGNSPMHSRRTVIGLLMGLISLSCEHSIPDTRGPTLAILKLNSRSLHLNYTVKGLCPPVVGENTWEITPESEPFRTDDAWGRPLALRKGSSKDMLVLGSLGVDGIPGTHDDIEIEIEMAEGCGARLFTVD